MKKLLLLFLLIPLSSFAQYTYYQLCDFETPNPMLKIDNPGSSIWQIGPPVKQLFNSAFSQPNAIVTDTIMPYPINVQSSFTLTIYNPAWWWGSPSVINFWHKYDTDSLHDGGYVEVSYDGGSEWVNIIKDTNDPCGMWWPGSPPWYWSNYFYDTTQTLANGQPGFSGNSDGWVLSSYEWLYCLGVKDQKGPDSIMIRFSFFSDSVFDNKEGWMIDDIVLHSNQCGGLDQLGQGDNSQVFPNPLTPESVVRLLSGEKAQLKVQICDIEGRILIQNEISDGIYPIGKEKLPPGLYVYRVLDNDGIVANGKFVVR